jgi:hypothetical protein
VRKGKETSEGSEAIAPPADSERRVMNGKGQKQQKRTQAEKKAATAQKREKKP